MSRIVSALVSALLLPLLVACGGAATDAKATPTVTASTPAGWKAVPAKATGVTLSTPGDWTVLDPDKLGNPAYNDRFASSAKALNMTTKQMVAMLKSLDVMVMAPKAVDGFNDNVNVVLVHLAELPSTEALRQQFRQYNAKVLKSTDVGTPLGRGRLVELQLPQPGGGSSYASGLFVKVSGGVANVTVSSSSTARARDLMARVLPTLRKG